MSNILPCPCCGGEPEVYAVRTGQGHGESYDEVGVRCRSCRLRMGLADYGSGEMDRARRDKAIAAWNQRAPIDAVPRPGSLRPERQTQQ